MRCVHINIRKASFILLSVLINSVQHSQMVDNHMDLTTKDQNEKNFTSINDDIYSSKPSTLGLELSCPSDLECNKLNHPCIEYKLNSNCQYGQIIKTTCEATKIVKCIGKRQFECTYVCRYCYQTEPWEHTCELKANCNSVATPKSYYRSNCTVKSDILCLGHRTFLKNIQCNWTGGCRWFTALALSITLGGFGADRFYLGHWQEGIGKLFSFGGLGVWTLIDVILISLHYLGPADGSLYI